MKIYLVIGDTGVYDSYRDWIVMAFKEKKAAEWRVLQASMRARDIWYLAGGGDLNELMRQDFSAWSDKYEDFNAFIKNQKNEFDPDMEMDSDGVNYRIQEVEYVEGN
jgi:hypothetical protein